MAHKYNSKDIIVISERPEKKFDKMYIVINPVHPFVSVIWDWGVYIWCGDCLSFVNYDDGHTIWV